MYFNYTYKNKTFEGWRCYRASDNKWLYTNGKQKAWYRARKAPKGWKKYIFENLGDDNDLSTMNMELEAFYSEARNADYLIYNSTIDAEITTIEELLGKSELADYLTTITIREAQRYTDSEIWTRVIWDVTAVAWLLNDGEKFMNGEIKKTPIVEYDSTYIEDEKGHLMNYIYYVSRDTLMRDFIKKIAL